MVDEKDRFGDKLHQSEKALEDQWARQQDAELLEKIRQKKATETAAMACPKCGQALVDKVAAGVHMLACPQHDGAWLDASALENLLKK
jgi:uncharacterized protein with PIN domain